MSPLETPAAPSAPQAPNTARVDPRPRPQGGEPAPGAARVLHREDPTIPREAKISFGIGVGIIGVLVAIPVAGLVLASLERGPTPLARPSAGPSGRDVGGRDAGAREVGSSPASGGGSSVPGHVAAAGPGGGGVPGATGSAGLPEGEPPPPFGRATHAFFRGLSALLQVASRGPTHLDEGRLASYLGTAFEDAPPEALAALEEAHSRAARARVREVRILAETPTPHGTFYDLELVADGEPGQPERVSRSRIQLERSDEEVKVLGLDPFDAFGPATPFEPRMVPHVVEEPTGAPLPPPAHTRPGEAEAPRPPVAFPYRVE